MTVYRRRDIARWIQDCFELSVRRSCRLIGLRVATWYYRSQARDTSVLRQRMRELATARPRFGHERRHILLTRKGWMVGRNKVHRLFKLEGLQVRRRARRQPTNGRKFRVLTIIDKWHRQCVALQVDFSLTGKNVVDALNEVALNRALPSAITVDHGTKSTSKALDEWCNCAA